jgi:hypothetical protein
LEAPASLHFTVPVFPLSHEDSLVVPGGPPTVLVVVEIGALFTDHAVVVPEEERALESPL